MRFPTKIILSCNWVAIPVDWVNLHWHACGADGRSVVGGRRSAVGGRRSVYGHVIPKFSGMSTFTYPGCSAGVRFARAMAPLY